MAALRYCQGAQRCYMCITAHRLAGGRLSVHALSSLQTQEEHTGLLPQLEIGDNVGWQHRQIDDVLQHRVLVLA